MCAPNSLIVLRIISDISPLPGSDGVVYSRAHNLYDIGCHPEYYPPNIINTLIDPLEVEPLPSTTTTTITSIFHSDQSKFKVENKIVFLDLIVTHIY